MEKINHELLAQRFFESGLSFRTFEKITSISRGTLHNVLTGTHKPSYPVAYRINEVLVLSQEDVLAIYFPNAKPQGELSI